ncbi:MAG: hypothetical protein PHO27_02180 [Sulfuricurvum sp.]|nr:hypothetical protein [Sulfuricurvum sp.]
MSKNETFIFRLFGVMIFCMPLHSEIEVGLLISIDSNSKVKLLSKNISVPCEAFGILPLDEILKKAVNPKECQAQIEIFYHTHPHEKVFAAEHLTIQQNYHYEEINGECVLYANGLESYSEMLLRQGLAIIDPTFNNKEWNGKLLRAKKGAEVEKLGLYDTEIRKYCIKEEK